MKDGNVSLRRISARNQQGRPRLRAALALALVAVLAGQAAAADFCMEYVGESLKQVDMVGKGFRVPAKGRCKPFLGFAHETSSLDTRDVAGGACTDSQGKNVHFVLTQTQRYFGTTTTLHVTVPLPLGPLGSLQLQRGANPPQQRQVTAGACPFTSPVP